MSESLLMLCSCCKQQPRELLMCFRKVGGKVTACALCSFCRHDHWKREGEYLGVALYVPVVVGSPALRDLFCPLTRCP